jgi:tyrosine-protein phosphatase SIW14
MAASGIRHHIIDMKGTKKESIPIQTMRDILRIVLDQQHYPLMIHCNHGKVCSASPSSPKVP